MKGNEIIEKNRLILISLILNIVIFSLILFLYFYLTKPQEFIEIYTSSYYSKYLILTSIILIVKIIISGYLAHFFFQKWLRKNERHVIDIPFLLGLFFYLFVFAKIMDFVLYITYVNPKIFFIDVTTIVRFRYIYGIINLIPLYLLGLYLYIYKKNSNKPYSEILKIIRKNVLTFLIIYSIIWIILMFFFNNFYLIRFLLIGLATLLFISWIFYKAHQGRILPEINCFIISIGFFLYAISQISFPFLAIMLNFLIINAEIISNLIMEIFSSISFIIVLIGFKTQAKFSK